MKQTERKIIDVHHHVFPADHPVHPWNIESDYILMQKKGITDVLLSCPLVTDSVSAHRFNEFMQQQVSANPEHYWMLGALPYDDIGAAKEEISYVLDDLHAPGLGLNTHNCEIYLSDDSLDPVWEELNRRETVVFLHPNHKRSIKNQKILFMGNDSVYEYPFDTTRAVIDFVLKDKVSRWPNIRWIMPHAGGTIPFLAHRIAVSGHWGSIKQNEDEIMNALKSFYYDLTLNNSDVNYRFLKDFAGVDHLLYGTDYPPCGEALLEKDRKVMEQTDVFTEDEKRRICVTNAERLFGI